MTRIDPSLPIAQTQAALRLSAAYGPVKEAPSGTDAFSIARARAVRDEVSVQAAVPVRTESLVRSLDRLSSAKVAVAPVNAVEPVQPITQRASGTGTYTARGTLSLHDQPAARNAAATGVELGRRIDLQG